MMTKKKARLKDILIDHVYDYCYTECVYKIESESINLTYDNPNQLKDPITKDLLEQALKSGKIKSFIAPRDQEYCKIIIDDIHVHQTLTDKLLNQGFKKGKCLHSKIEKAQKYLLVKSYLSRSKIKENEVKLTEKGLEHYLKGKSFEEDFIRKRNSKIAIWISIFSFIIALIALLFNLLRKSNAA